MHYFGCGEKEVKLCVGIMRNFYNYILHHDVCPEFASDIYAARTVCDIAEKELVSIEEASKLFPGDFNVACSALSGGHHATDYAKLRPWTEGAVAEDEDLLPPEHVSAAVQVGLRAYGSEQMLRSITKDLETNSPESSLFEIVSEERQGLEVTKVQPADDTTRELYEKAKKHGGPARPLGKLCCKSWEPPTFASYDRPQQTNGQETTKLQREFEFWVEDDVLVHCFPGMKLEATVCELKNGLRYLDVVHMVYCSFYTLLPNELMRDWKEVKWLTSDRQVKSMQKAEEDVGAD